MISVCCVVHAPLDRCTRRGSAASLHNTPQVAEVGLQNDTLGGKRFWEPCFEAERGVVEWIACYCIFLHHNLVREDTTAPRAPSVPLSPWPKDLGPTKEAEAGVNSHLCTPKSHCWAVSRASSPSAGTKVSHPAAASGTGQSMGLVNAIHHQVPTGHSCMSISITRGQVSCGPSGITNNRRKAAQLFSAPIPTPLSHNKPAAGSASRGA